jgi:hypothetical protein
MENKIFNSILINNFKELESKYIKEKQDFWDGEEIGSTIVIEDLLLPYIYENIENPVILERLANFLEEVLSLNDDFCEEVLYSSFFEKVHYDNKSDVISKCFKDKTTAFYNGLKF